MANRPTPEEAEIWQRRLASQANNRAWELAELAERTPEDNEEMLQAAHAAMYCWKIVGTANNRAHAAQLVAHVYALLASPGPAKHYLAQSQPYFLGQACDAWEEAFAHAVAANVAAASGDREAHTRHYLAAESLVASLPDEVDRGIVEATMRVIAVPKD
jgi:hypothetical protein